MLVFGVGVQGRSSILATRAAFPSATFEVIGRRPERVEALRAELAAEGIEITHREDVDTAVSEAETLLILATTASTPLFDGALVKNNAIVAAIGTHGYDAREVDDTLVARADIVVEGRGSAQRETGNLDNRSSPRPTGRTTHGQACASSPAVRSPACRRPCASIPA